MKPSSSDGAQAVAGCVLAALIALPASGQDAGDVKRGASALRACLACHALEPGVHLTGPSLAGVWGRKAGALEDFHRYSGALKNSGVVWNARTLDAWLRDTSALVPGNYMAIQGIADAGMRTDLIAFLRSAQAGEVPPGLRRPRLPDLKNAPKNARVSAIRRCGDSYFVSTAAGETRPYWEFNLRFKTDSSTTGPRPGEPVMVPAAMQGDRAQIVFSSPAEISAFIKEKC
jgi:cytochrome c